jgi:hypothetical protein
LHNAGGTAPQLELDAVGSQLELIELRARLDQLDQLQQIFEVESRVSHMHPRISLNGTAVPTKEILAHFIAGRNNEIFQFDQ